jgi:hypothetical protein
MFAPTTAMRMYGPMRTAIMSFAKPNPYAQAVIKPEVLPMTLRLDPR